MNLKHLEMGSSLAGVRAPTWETVDVVEGRCLLPAADIKAQLPQETGLYIWCVKPPARTPGSRRWYALYLGQAGGGPRAERGTLHKRLSAYVSNNYIPNIVGPIREPGKRAHMQALQERSFTFQVR